MSDSYTLPRNFRFQPNAQVSATSLTQHGVSIPNLHQDMLVGNEMQRFGSVPANLQTLPFQNIPSIPVYTNSYPYNYPSRPLSAPSSAAYQIPTPIPTHLQHPQMNWRRPTSAFYPVSSPNDYFYTGIPVTRSASYPLQHTTQSPQRRHSMPVNKGSTSDESNNNVKKIQLANKLELEEVKLNKKSREAYVGLVIEVLPESLDQDVILVVQRVTVGGLCQKDGRIKRGDRILKVNGYRVKDFDSAMENLRQPNVTITVARVTKQFKREHLRTVSCSLFGYKPSLKPSKTTTVFSSGTPRLAKGVNEVKLELEMISLCRRLERVKKGSKKSKWHSYNVDREEYLSRNTDSNVIKKHQKKATKQQGTDVKKRALKVQKVEPERKVLDEPLSNKPITPSKRPKAAYNSNNISNPTHLQVYRTMPVMQPQRYWVPTVSSPQYNPMYQIRQVPINYSPYQNGGVYQQKMRYPKTRRTPIPEYFKQGNSQASTMKRSPISKRSSSGVEETLL
ncbi:hypothetical protein LOD99_3576 [Oopsacas minuta]|uniref:PDZ domain-containing protein n=1 Tax=Oopsacas minuta TaxID=111878 RepID=A0AAV7JXE1_9METZ|nr:hypothetical protein LOD99_3576 [Oopsacas minuta]